MSNFLSPNCSKPFFFSPLAQAVRTLLHLQRQRLWYCCILFSDAFKIYNSEMYRSRVHTLAETAPLVLFYLRTALEKCTHLYDDTSIFMCRRISQYISLDLFYFVSLTSSCSLIPWTPHCCILFSEAFKIYSREMCGNERVWLILLHPFSGYSHVHKRPLFN